VFAVVRTPDSKIRSPQLLFGAVGMRNPDWPFATVFPEFIARVGKSLRQGCCQGGKQQGWCGPQGEAWGHGPVAPWRHPWAGYRRGQGDEVRRDGEQALACSDLPTARKRQRAGPNQGIGP